MHRLGQPPREAGNGLDAELELRGPELEPTTALVTLAFAEGGAVVDLDARQTDIVGTVLQTQTAASLSLGWRGHVRARMPAIEVVATADIDEIRRRTASLGPIRRGQLTIVTR
ncbi:MAG TPA: hypothetical protein VFL56_07045, partial [Solirubrobacterales bacterium]|nr:hypothetical protein [Solirubrobacterales bacterium]